MKDKQSKKMAHTRGPASYGARTIIKEHHMNGKFRFDEGGQPQLYAQVDHLLVKAEPLENTHCLGSELHDIAAFATDNLNSGNNRTSDGYSSSLETR